MSIVAKFEIEFFQYLNENGELTQPLPEFAKDPKTLLDLYRKMLLIRTFDAKAIALQRTGKMGTFPSSLGQEAVAVGIGSAMRKDDVFVPYYRDQGTLIMRGVKPSLIYAYWGGDERGSVFSENPEDFPICVPIATQLLHADGIAYAIKYRKQARAVVTICGDGGTSEGDFYEAINFAGAQKLPVVFVVNNNKWAISVPLSKQTACKTLAQKAIAGGFDGFQVDGNDLIAMREKVSEALDKARNGGGPTLIEALTYRLADHTTADDAKRYVDKSEIEAAWKNEPFLRLQLYLQKQGLWSEQEQEKLQKECTEAVAKATEEYLNMPTQPKTAILDYLYETLPTAYASQRQEIENLPDPGEGH
jgi:2-oxoisovalerate dehydrogenase E1 component alpha subunit